MTHSKLPNDGTMKINGFSVIASATLLQNRHGEYKTVILGARVLNRFADDYEYVVAEIENWDATSWPSGKYTRTLGVALGWFTDLAEGRAAANFGSHHIVTDIERSR